MKIQMNDNNNCYDCIMANSNGRIFNSISGVASLIRTFLILKNQRLATDKFIMNKKDYEDILAWSK